MTFTAMQPSYMTTQQLGHAPQLPTSPLPLGQLTGQLGQPGQLGLAQLTQPLVAQLDQATQADDQILPQEHLVSPLTFWTKLARCGIRYGALAVRQILESVLYQQIAQVQLSTQYGQQTSPLQAQQLGMVMPQPVAQQQIAAPAVMALQEEQILPQEHLVSPLTFWTKLARVSMRQGVHVARQILETVQLQHQVQVVQVQQQVQLLYGQQFAGQPYPVSAVNGQQAYGQQFVPQVPMSALAQQYAQAYVQPNAQAYAQTQPYASPYTQAYAQQHTQAYAQPYAQTQAYAGQSYAQPSAQYAAQQQYAAHPYAQPYAQAAPQYVSQPQQAVQQQAPVLAGAGI